MCFKLITYFFGIFSKSVNYHNSIEPLHIYKDIKYKLDITRHKVHQGLKGENHVGSSQALGLVTTDLVTRKPT